jgi:hypothetical protein
LTLHRGKGNWRPFRVGPEGHDPAIILRGAADQSTVVAANCPEAAILDLQSKSRENRQNIFLAKACFFPSLGITPHDGNC